MIATAVDAHVDPFRHVAVDALGARRSRRVKVMLARVVAVRVVTTHAQGVALGAQGQPMRFVAVSAGDALVVHAALHK